VAQDDIENFERGHPWVKTRRISTIHCDEAKTIGQNAYKPSRRSDDS
jgi:hypothetical protein